MMKRALVALTLLVCAGAQAQKLDNVALREYAQKALPRCPGASLTLEPVQGGPTNFHVYTATLRSSDQYCGTKKYLLHSPKTGQVILGTVIELPADGRPANVRVAAQASQMLNQSLTAAVSPFPLPDGIKTVDILRQTPYGTFSYRGFVDASERFLIVGSRGTLMTDPGASLRDTLGVSSAVRRGNPKAKVEIIELSDFQCPTCAHAHAAIDPIIRKNLDRINYLRLDLPLFEHHEWALQAAAGARAIQKVAPGKYWEYVDYVFTNQDLVGKQKFDSFIKDYCEDHDLDWNAVQKVYNSKSERQALLDQVSRAFSIGVASTPTFILNGQILGFGPEGSFTTEAIKTALAQAGPARAATPAKKTTPKAAKKKS